MTIKVFLCTLCACYAHGNWIDSGQADVPKCAANEEYQCGSSCFESCQGTPDACTLQWICGYVSKAGYVRLLNSKGARASTKSRLHLERDRSMSVDQPVHAPVPI